MAQQPRPLKPSASPEAAFGARLRALRAERGWSQAHLGRLVHVSGDLIGKIEKAVRRPMPDLVDRLDAVLEAQGDLIRAREAFPTERVRPAGRPTAAGRYAGAEPADAEQEWDDPYLRGELDLSQLARGALLNSMFRRIG